MKKEIEKVVLKTLQEKPETRSDDYLLVLEVLNHYVDDNISLAGVMRNHVQLGLPSLETITRCRRRLQQEDPSLIDENAKRRRTKETEEILEYLQERGC